MSWIIIDKSQNLVFNFLLEPCYIVICLFQKVDTEALIAAAVNEEKRRAQVELQEKLTAVRREAMTKVADEQNALLADLKKEENEVCCRLKNNF